MIRAALRAFLRFVLGVFFRRIELAGAESLAAEGPAVLVANHGPFAWGKDAASAAHNAVILEHVARTAYVTMQIHPQAQPISGALHDKHFLRKHGARAYYGQKKGKA